MSSIRTLIVAPFLLVLVTGCDTEMSEVDFMRESLSLMCENLARCGIVADETSCVAGLAPEGGFPTSLGPNVTFDRRKAAECVDALRAGSCQSGDLFGAVAIGACIQALHGTVPSGGSCVNDIECESSDCAVDASCAQQCCAGTCQPKWPAGDACALFDYDPATMCPAGSSCSCLTGTCSCRPRVADGERCYTSLDCADGSICAISNTGTCQKPLAAGSTCDPRVLYACDVGLGCDPATERCAAKLRVGERCTVEGMDCVVFAECVDSTCTALPGDGEVCSGRCALGYECTDGRCSKGPPFCI